VKIGGQGACDLAADKAGALKLTPVSRETEQRLDLFVKLLILWQSKFNLVSSSSLPFVWTRHVADSLQLLEHAPDALTWADFGSGAGFPGVPIACALAEKSGVKVHLIESVGKKANFLCEVVRITGIPAIVHHLRVENFGESDGDKLDVVMARALSPLKDLCDQSFPWINRGAVGIFPKGQDVDVELTEAAKYWNIEAKKVPSKTNPASSLLLVSGLRRRESS